MRRLIMTLGFGLVIAACGGDSNDPAASTTTGAPQVTTSVSSTTNQAATPPSTEQPTTTTTTVAAAAAPTMETLATSLADVTTIDVDVEGTSRPRFSWAATASAASYIAVVADEDGAVLWAWGGESASVTVGAGEVDRDGVGARIAKPGWLQVIGFDTDGAIIAASKPVPVG